MRQQQASLSFLVLSRARVCACVYACGGGREKLFPLVWLSLESLLRREPGNLHVKRTHEVTGLAGEWACLLSLGPRVDTRSRSERDTRVVVGRRLSRKEGE